MQPPSSFKPGLGTKFTFEISNGFIIYEIDLVQESFCKCTQITNNNEWPATIYLSQAQLKHITIYTQQIHNIGTEFMMGTNSDTSYKIININAKQQHYECIQILSSSLESAVIYLSFAQFEFVNVSKSSVSPPTSTNSEEDDLEHLSHILPYFTDFIRRKEKSVLVLDQNKFQNDPSGYLKAIRTKYNIKHRREYVYDEEEDDDNDDGLRPWIEGKMEKLNAESGYFVREKWKTRLFRLFDEALVWFDDDSFLSKLKRNRRRSRNKNKNNINVYDDNEYMTPFGVLPLAMITGLKTADIDAMAEGKVSEDELLRLELEIGDEGVIILKCSDFEQRIKWFECLHCAIFAVQKPVFVKDKDLWRISEPKPIKSETQLTKGDLSPVKRGHVKMGKSLAFRLNDIKTRFTPSTPQFTADDPLNNAFDHAAANTNMSTNTNDVELQIIDNQQLDARVPSMSNDALSAINIVDDVKIL